MLPFEPIVIDSLFTVLDELGDLFLHSLVPISAWSC